MEQDTPTVFVVDDDEAMRDSLQWLLRSAGYAVATFASGEEFLAAVGVNRHGCLLLDVRMHGMSGLELHERLHAGGYTLPVVFITAHGDVPMAVSAFRQGATDFIEKPFNDDDLVALIERCLETDRHVRATGARSNAAVQRLASLTPREREVLDLIVAGKLNKQIADILGISTKTVEAHRGRVMDKMAVRTVADLVHSALQASGGQRE
jgi:FixJ family two-component response regulator